MNFNLPLIPILLLLLPNFVLSEPPQTTPFIKIDQFGYFCESKKVAVIADPQIGFNAAQAFTPGNTFEVRAWDTDKLMYSGAVSPWKGGQLHNQSGDRGWWFDFSEVNEPGTYYIFDPQNQVGSYAFRIGSDVYDEVLKVAVRTYFYQRVNYIKEAKYVGNNWADAASYEGPNQDRFATSRFDKGNPATAKDVHGGWYDAGDPNKYTTFAFDPMMQLMTAYRLNPNTFTDDYNIPESGNGIADLLDEVKYELDWLKRMQDGTGTNGFFLKVGVDNYNEVTPPSTDTRPRYYLPECTSSTISGMGMFALAAIVYQALPDAEMKAYGADLLERAEAAWARAKVTTNNFSTFQTECDDQDIKAGDADMPGTEQFERAVTSAIYLFEATGKAAYKEFVEQNYTTVRPYSESYWSPYRMATSYALLYYSQLPGVSASVSQNILAQKSNSNSVFSVDQYQSEADLYRAFMEDWAYHWGSNSVRSNVGNINLDFNTFGLNPSNESLYTEVAEQHLHWLHGVNPLSIVMLSNMYDFGADSSVNEFYHFWFSDGSEFDNAKTSPKGPAPGYLTGGPNASYTESRINPPYNQPPQKSYKDWNGSWNGTFTEASWEITENSITYQGPYILFLSRLISLQSACKKEETPTPDNPTISLVNIFLEGFLLADKQEMNTDLQKGNLIPNSQPFNQAPWNYGGSEQFTSADISWVDWVLVELRDSDGNLLEQQACLLTQTGEITTINGETNIPFSALTDASEESDFVLAIHHKSHLAVAFDAKSGATIDPLNGSKAIGFEQQIDINGTPALFCGDFDGNGNINNLDFNLWAKNSAAVGKYLEIDADGNGIVNNRDYNYWTKNRAKLRSDIIK